MHQDSQRDLLADIQALEQRAHKLAKLTPNMTLIAHSLNQTMNAMGWVMAGDMDAAIQASKRERPGES